MSKVIITFEDTEDGRVDVKVTSEPPFDVNVAATGAQQMALQALFALKEEEDEQL